MKRLIVPLVLTALALCSCSPSSLATPTPFATPTPVTPTPSDEPSATPPSPTNAICNEIAFYLDPALATGYTCETVLADPGPMNPAPEMTRITLLGYSPSATNPISPQIFVMPVDEYGIADPSTFPDALATLQGLLSASSPPVYGVSAPTPMPVLPQEGGIPGPFAQYAVVSFADGDGIRFITQKSFDAVPLGNDRTFYTFQGLTTGSQYWVSALLPTQHPILPASADVPPVGMTWDDFWTGYDTYMTNIVNQLNAQSPESFDPQIAMLDALVASIVLIP
ncbi:MAG: hypothetical protein JW722_05585 [Demequinaceae bacterium]|nr:hypothetical protein [Demequinaceae bacterium]